MVHVPTSIEKCLSCFSFFFFFSIIYQKNNKMKKKKGRTEIVNIFDFLFFLRVLFFLFYILAKLR